MVLSPLRFARLPAVLLTVAFVACAARAADEAGAYFVPENPSFARLVRGNGEVIEFIASTRRPSYYRSPSGWVAEVEVNGRANVWSNADRKLARHAYAFKNGRAISYAGNRNLGDRPQ